MQKLTERDAFALVQKWVEYKNSLPGRKPSTQRSYIHKMNALRKYLTSDDPVTESTLQKICATDQDHEYSYLHRMASMLKWSIKHAIKTGALSKYPFHDDRLKGATFEHQKVSLNYHQVKQLREFPLIGKLDTIRKLFYTQLRTGLSYADFRSIPRIGVIKPVRVWDPHRNCTLVVNYLIISRKKTDKACYVRLDDELEDLIAWLHTVVIPELSDYNKKLKVLQQEIGLELVNCRGESVGLKSHHARKTYSQEKYERGVSLQALATSMGNNERTQTGHYVNMNFTVLDQELKKAF